MEVVSPKSVASSNRIAGRSFLSPQFDLRPKSPMGYREGLSIGIGGRMADVGSRLQNLLQGKDPSVPYKGALLKDIRSKRPLLAETEQKIFSEVIGLVDEIDEFKQTIFLYQQQIRKIQIEHPDVQEQVGYHGYSQPLTIAQCSDLQDQNAELTRRIQEIESRQMLNLQQVLQLEKQKYEELKQELAESTDPVAANRAAEGKIAELKIMIEEIQRDRKAKLKVHYPGIERLKGQNQELRQKTIANLRVQKLQGEEERELAEYLRKQQGNRIQFVEELKKFKAEFKRLKQQNQNLKDRLQQKALTNSKENSAAGANRHSYSKTGINEEYDKSWLQVDSSVRRGGEKRDKLSQYENFIKMMQDSLRK